MNIYKLTQNVNNGYDTYDSCIVTAKNEEEARLILPSNYDTWEKLKNSFRPSWVRTPDQVRVILIGKASKGSEPGVVLASFNAG